MQFASAKSGEFNDKSFLTRPVSGQIPIRYAKQYLELFLMSAVNPYEAPNSESADIVPAVDGPAIWNPNAAANWSLLFSPAFGAYLHARNAERLGRHDEAKSNWRWFYGSLSFLAASILSTFVPVVSDGLFRLIGILILLTWYFSVAKTQAAFVDQAFGKVYPKRSLLEPVLIGFSCLVGLFLVFFFIGFVTALVNDSPGI